MSIQYYQQNFLPVCEEVKKVRSFEDSIVEINEHCENEIDKSLICDNADIPAFPRDNYRFYNFPATSLATASNYSLDNLQPFGSTNK